MRNSDVPMDWHLARLEDTHHCDEAWRARMKLKRCWTYFAFDKNRHVHVCELTPSYELWPAEFDYECEEGADEDQRQAVFEELLRAFNDREVEYVHVRDLDAPKNAENVRKVGAFAIDPDDIPDSFRLRSEPAYFYAAQVLREDASSNHPGW